MAVVFISSTFTDLREERAAVQDALRQGECAPWGMEFFVSEPTHSLEVCIRELDTSDAVVLIIGFRGGSLIPENPNLTYTGAEFERALLTSKPVFVFIKTAGGCWQNRETEELRRSALDDLKNKVQKAVNPAYFESSDQLKFEVLAAFKRWDAAGRPGVRKTFASREEYFARYERKSDKGALFDFNQALQGRDAELKALTEFLDDPDLLVGLLVGRGGVGKSRLLRDGTAALDGWEVVFLREGAIWHRESEKEIPLGKVLAIVDDAHRAEHLDQLLPLLRDLGQRRQVKLVLSTRPTGLPSLRALSSRHFEPTLVKEFPRLEKLGLDQLRALAREVLGPAHQMHVEPLVRLSPETPLVTVIGGRLIARGTLSSHAIVNEDEFRRVVFDRFIDEYTTPLPGDSFPGREVINVIAAVGPVRPRLPSFLGPAESFLDIRQDQVLRAVDALEENGILLRAGDLLRIAPDPLADYLLEVACVSTRGERTGYAEEVFHCFRAGHLSNLLSNLAELDWRLKQKGCEAGILEQIWRVLRQEFESADAVERWNLLEALKGAAIFQPSETLAIIHIAMETQARPGMILNWIRREQGDVLKQLAPLLESVAYHPQHTEEAVRRLFSLAKMDIKGPNWFSREPAKVLKELASYHLYQPVGLLEKMADIANDLVAEPGAFDGLFSPLDIADTLLAKEIEHHESNETTFRLGSLPLNYPVFREVRQKALALVDKALNSSGPKAAACAVASISSVLPAFQPLPGRETSPEEEAWQDAERLQILGLLERRIHRQPLPIPLLRQIQSTLRQHRLHHYRELVQARLQGLLAAIPQSEQLMVFDAFCTPHWELHGDQVSLIEVEKGHYVEVQRAVHILRAQYPLIEDQIAALEGMATQADAYGIRVVESAGLFIELLCRDPEFGRAFLEYVLGKPHPTLGFQICMLVPTLRDSDVLAYRKVGIAAAQHPMADVASGAAHGVFFGSLLGTPMDEDAEIVRELAKHSASNVRGIAIESAARLGRHPKYLKTALEILLSADLEADRALAHRFCDAFSATGIPISMLSDEELRVALGKLVRLERLDNHQVREFLDAVGDGHPELLLDFLLLRLDYHASLQQGTEAWVNYSPVIREGLLQRLKTPRPASTYADELRRIRDRLTDDRIPPYWLGQLFWGFGASGDVKLSVINEWIVSDDPGKRRAAEYLLEGGPPPSSTSTA